MTAKTVYAIWGKMGQYFHRLRNKDKDSNSNRLSKYT